METDRDETANRDSVRALLIVAHRWVALVVGAILLLTAASGATLVFEGAIDRGLNPQLWRVTPSGTTLPIDTIIARVEASSPWPRSAPSISRRRATVPG